jgi:hypothetical protein
MIKGHLVEVSQGALAQQTRPVERHFPPRFAAPSDIPITCCCVLSRL